MLQTLIWRNVRIAPAKVAPTGWWPRHRALLLPQIIVVFGVLALLCGALWAMRAYAEHRAELRLTETNRFLDQFRSGPVAHAWARVRTAWQLEQDRQDALLARVPSLGETERARALHDHHQFVLETIEEYALQDDIEVVRQFVIRLATCVRVGSCDRNAAAAQLGPALWAFRDQHREYFEFEYSGIDLDRHLETIAPRPATEIRPLAPRW